MRVRMRPIRSAPPPEFPHPRPHSPRRSASEWASLVAAHERSGLTVRAFAEFHGLRAASLSWWRWRLRSDEATTHALESPRLARVSVHVAPADPASAGPGFPALSVSAAPAAPAWELAFTDGAVLRVYGAIPGDALAMLLRAPRRPCPRGTR